MGRPLVLGVVGSGSAPVGQSYGASGNTTGETCDAIPLVLAPPQRRSYCFLTHPKLPELKLHPSAGLGFRADTVPSQAARQSSKSSHHRP